MSSTFLMGVDVGVSYIKAGIYNLEGEVISSAANQNPGEYPKQGMFIQNSEIMLDIVIKTIKEAVEAANLATGKIEAIGFSGAMGGLMGVDKNWQPVVDWSIISDTRFYPYVVNLLNDYSEEILRYSGTNFPVFAPKLLWWKNDFNSAYKKIVKIMGIYGFMIGRMGNIPIEDATIDRTITMFSGFVDLPNSKWSQDLCKEFGIDNNILPRIVESSTVTGKLSKEIANLCGLESGIPLVAGAGDKAAGNLGAGLVVPGFLIDEVATYGALSVCVDKYVPDIQYRTLENLPSPINGLYTPGCYLFGSGAISAWFAKVFATEEQKQAESEGRSVFRVLDENAAGIPAGSEGLFSISLLMGRGYPSDPAIKGMWIGQTMTHKIEHFYKSLLEGLAYEYGYFYSVMKNNYTELDFNEVTVIGGGSRSDLYNQIKCDVLNVPFTRLDRDDSALLGDALIAGSAIGMIKNLKELVLGLKIKGKTYFPITNNHEIYNKYLGFHKGIFNRVRDIYLDLKSIDKGNSK